MSSSVDHDERARIDGRLTTIGLAATAVAIEATLRAPEPASPVSTSAETLAVESAAAPTASMAGAALPHISVDARTGPGRARPIGAPGAPDLSIVSTLGEGGQGRVHLAWQRSLGREVAIKTIKDEASASAAAALLAEARLTGSLEHPGVIPVHALGVDDAGRPVLVMKRIDGVDWQTLAADPTHRAWRSRLSEGEDRLVANLEILMRVCETLELAHSRGIVHRDIKPENVMIGEFGEVYLVDWGIAMKADGAPVDALVGTPMFMAPEMAVGRPVDARTDVYLLGATLHLLLTGEPRHAGTTLPAVLYAAASSEPVAYERTVPRALADLANRATTKDPALRPPSARAFRNELATHLRLRSAERLAAAATERLDELRAALDAAGEAVPADLARAYRAGNEARFGLSQCLRDHVDFEPASRGLGACIEALIELELRQAHGDSAAVLLGELQAPSPALVERVERAREAAARAQRETDALRAMARELDPSAGRVPRVLGLLALGVFVAGIVVWVVRSGGGEGVSLSVLVRVNTLILAAVVGVTFALRRSVWTTTFNRRMAGILVLSVAGSAINRWMGLLDGSSVFDVLQRDALVFACVIATAAITTLSALWAAVATILTMLVVMRIDPDHASLTFGVGSTVNVFVVAAILWRRGRRPSAEEPPAV